MQAKNSYKTEDGAYQSFYEHTFVPFDVEEPETAKYVFKVIRLNPGVSRLNFICSIIYSAILIFGLAATATLQPFILIDKNYYNVPQEQSGSYTSLILVIQLIMKVITSIPYGYLSDQFGRKPMIFFGATNFLASCLLVPIQTSIFPGLVLSKILLANGIGALHAVPLLADYVSDESKGKAVGITAIMMGIGAMFSNIIIKVLFYNKSSLGFCYSFIGVLVCTVLILLMFGLKGGNFRTHNPDVSLSLSAKLASFLQNLQEAITIFRANGWLMVALVLQVLGSSDFFIFFTFMTLYIKSMFPEGTDESISNIAVSNIQSLVMIPTLFCNFFYGYFVEKKGKAIMLSYFVLIGGTIAFLVISLSKSPTDISLKLSAILLGSTIPGLFIINGYLSMKNFPPDKRGIMVGFTGAIGYLGHFVIASGGGYLYDHWRKDGPFLIAASMLVIAVFLIAKISSVYGLSKST